MAEGAYVSTGWVDYRDNYLGPELKESLVKGADGAWKIRHSHTSSRRKPPAQTTAKP